VSDWDGHTLTLHIGTQEISADAHCPHSGEDLTAVGFEKLPRCRTEPREPGVPWPDCSVIRGWKDVGAEAIEGARFGIAALPVRIGWRWDSKDGLYVWPIESTEDNLPHADDMAARPTLQERTMSNREALALMDALIARDKGDLSDEDRDVLRRYGLPEEPAGDAA
jgi:hypothetical protein